MADFSRPYVRDDFLFDAIITDPPYGIREKTKRVKSQHTDNENDLNVANSAAVTSEDPVENAGETAFKCIHPKHSKYQLADIYYDLLDFAVRHLVDNGRLVFWLPVYLEEAERKSMR